MIVKQGQSDPSGLINFGTVPLGKYTLLINADAADSRGEVSIIVGPEGYEAVEYRCPDGPADPVDLKFQLRDVPAALRDAVFSIHLDGNGMKIDECRWRANDRSRRLLLRSDGSVIGEVMSADEYSITPKETGPFAGWSRLTGNRYYFNPDPLIRADDYTVHLIEVLFPDPTDSGVPDGDFKGVVLAVPDNNAASSRHAPDDPELWTIDVPKHLTDQALAMLFNMRLYPVPDGMTLAMPLVVLRSYPPEFRAGQHMDL